MQRLEMMALSSLLGSGAGLVEARPPRNPKLVYPSAGKFAVISVRSGREMLIKEVDTVEEASTLMVKIMVNTMDVLAGRDHVMIMYQDPKEELDRQEVASLNKNQFKKELKSPTKFIRKQLEKLGKANLISEAQRVAPALAFGDEDNPVKPGAFKVSTKVLKLLKRETGMNTGDVLFKKVRDLVAGIPYGDLPSYVGKKEMTDAQDFIAGKPRAAFDKWLNLLARNNAKLGKYVRSVPENASLVFYLFSVRINGQDLTDILFKRYFETDPEHPEAIKAMRGRKQESVEPMTLDTLEDEAESIMASARTGSGYQHDDRPRQSVGAPNIEDGLRQQALSAMGVGGMLVEGRQSTALLMEGPPDVLSWLMGRDLQGDIERNNGYSYIPTGPVLGNRERQRQRDEIDAIGRKQFGHNYVSEFNGDKSLWVTHRMADRASGEYGNLMRIFAKELKKHGYSVETKAAKDRPALIDTMYVLFDLKRIKDAERGIGKYLDAMRKGGATRMGEGIGRDMLRGQLLVSADRQTMPTMDELLEGVQVCVEEGLEQLEEALNGKVTTFIQIFISTLVQYDKDTMAREMKRGMMGNVHRLPLLLQAAQKVEADVASVAQHDDPASIALLRASLNRRFNTGFPPLTKILKQIDAYVADGKLPKLPISKEVKAAMAAEKAALRQRRAPMAAESLLDRIALASFGSVREAVAKPGSALDISLKMQDALMGKGWVALTDVSKGTGFRGVHFAKIESAAASLQKKGQVETKTDPRQGLMLKLKRREESALSEAGRDDVKAVSSATTWGGYRVAIPDKNKKALLRDKAVQALLGRVFEYPSAAMDAARLVFPNAKTAMM